MPWKKRTVPHRRAVRRLPQPARRLQRPVRDRLQDPPQQGAVSRPPGPASRRKSCVSAAAWACAFATPAASLSRPTTNRPRSKPAARAARRRKAGERMSAPGPAERPLRLGPAPSRAEDQAPTPPARLGVPCALRGRQPLCGAGPATWPARLRRHRSGQGARYTRMRGAVQLAYARRCETRAKPCAPKPPSNGCRKRKKRGPWPPAGGRAGRDSPAQATCATPRPSTRCTLVCGSFDRDLPVCARKRWPRPSRPSARRWDTGPFLLAGKRGRAAVRLCLRPPAAPARGVRLVCGDHDLLRTRLRGAGGRPAAVHAAAGAAAPPGLLCGRGACRAPQPGSEAFHKAMGFHSIGRQPRCGYKFGPLARLADLVARPAPRRSPARPGAPPAARRRNRRRAGCVYIISARALHKPPGRVGRYRQNAVHGPVTFVQADKCAPGTLRRMTIRRVGV